MSSKPVLLFAAFALLTSCSLERPNVVRCTSNESCQTFFGEGSVCRPDGYCVGITNCTSNTECREAIGFGSVCTATGQCADAASLPRCAHTIPTDLLTNPRAYRDRVVFGAIFDESSTVHVGRLHAAELAVNVIGDSTGVEDVRFGIVFCDIRGGMMNSFGDGLGRLDAARQVSTWLSDELGTSAIIGPQSSEDTESIFTEVVQPRMPNTILISPAAAGPTLTALEAPASEQAPGGLWRTSASATDQSTLIAADMATRTPAIRRVAILREQGAFGQGLAEPFIEAWTSAGGTSSEFVFDNPSARAELVSSLGIQVANFDAIYVIAQAGDTAAILALMSEDMRFTEALFVYFPQTGGSNSVFAGIAATRLFTRIRAFRPSVPRTETFALFREAYARAFPDADDVATITNAPHTYDAVWIAALGAVWAREHDVVEGQGIARGIRHLVDGERHVALASDWQRTVRQLRSEDARVDLEGVSGALDFDLITEETTGAVERVEGQVNGTFRALP